MEDLSYLGVQPELFFHFEPDTSPLDVVSAAYQQLHVLLSKLPPEYQEYVLMCGTQHEQLMEFDRWVQHEQVVDAGLTAETAYLYVISDMIEPIFAASAQHYQDVLGDDQALANRQLHIAAVLLHAAHELSWMIRVNDQLARTASEEIENMETWYRQAEKSLRKS